MKKILTVFLLIFSMSSNLFAFDEDRKKSKKEECLKKQDYYCVATYLADLSAGGDNKAKAELVFIYSEGYAVEKDLDIALSLLHQIREDKDPTALVKLARFYYVEPEYFNFNDAIYYAKQSVDFSNYESKNDDESIKSYLDSLNFFGVMYENGYAIKKDFNKAFELYEKAVNFMEEQSEEFKVGFPYSNLASFYFFGKGSVKQNKEKAIELLSKARMYEQFKSRKFYEEEEFIRENDRLPKNYEEFINWLEKKLATEESENFITLGWLLENSNNTKEAYKWFYIASFLNENYYLRKSAEISLAIAEYLDLLSPIDIKAEKTNARNWAKQYLNQNILLLEKQKNIKIKKSYYTKANYPNLEVLGKIKFNNKTFKVKKYFDGKGPKKTKRNCLIYEHSINDWYSKCTNIIEDTYYAPYNNLDQGILFGNLENVFIHNQNSDDDIFRAKSLNLGDLNYACVYRRDYDEFSKYNKKCSVYDFSREETKDPWLVYGSLEDGLETQVDELEEEELERLYYRAKEMDVFAQEVEDIFDEMTEIKIVAIPQEEQEKNEIVTVEGDDDKVVPASSGSGFFVTNDIIVTNNHVVEGCKKVQIHYDGKETPASIISSDRTNDLSLIKAEIKAKEIFSVSNDDVSLMEEIYVAGYPLGKAISAAIKVTSGRVSALAGYGDNFSNFQIDAALNYGNSGGPIINNKGNVVGVAVATLDKSEVESFNFGIKSSTLQTFTKANKVKLAFPNYREMSMKDLGKKITDATVYVECWMTVADIKLALSQETQKAFYNQYRP